MNLWAAANLGAAQSGDRPRLKRELDRLHGLGVRNVRLFGAIEGLGSGGRECAHWCVGDGKSFCGFATSPVECACVGCNFCRGAVTALGEAELARACPGATGGVSAHMEPAMQPRPGEYDEDVLEGLDYALAALAARGMTAVVVLNNMWQWSGGFAAYVSWATGAVPPLMTPSAQDEDWQAHQAFALKFYSTPKAIAIWQRHVRTLVERRNSVSGLRYGADPTILSWQLANEPRALNQGSAYRKWIETSAAFIRSIDCYHLVSLGSEGPTPWPGYVRNSVPSDHVHIDYVAVHVWPQNWNWYDPSGADPTRSMEEMWPKALAYVKAALEGVEVATPLARTLASRGAVGVGVGVGGGVGWGWGPASPFPSHAVPLWHSPLSVALTPLHHALPPLRSRLASLSW